MNCNIKTEECTILKKILKNAATSNENNFVLQFDFIQNNCSTYKETVLKLHLKKQ